MLKQIEQRFAEIVPAVDFCSLRFVQDRSEQIEVRQDVLQPVATAVDCGAMLTVIHKGGIGYGATSDLSVAGLTRAAAEAVAWAARTAGRTVVDFAKVPPTVPRGEYATTVTKPWDALSLADKVDLLKRECARLKIDDRIVDWRVMLWYGETETLFLTTGGGRVHQVQKWLYPGISATAFANGESQTRTHGGHAFCRQGGLETLDAIGFYDAAPRVAAAALELLTAPNCPTGKMDLVLAPDQMYLQIHESIGHPLELDRILGDERNYAGTSFVTPEMVGTYQYGSKLLNITFDPTRAGELAAYAFDDDGTPARREYLIKDGILVRVLGGHISQSRSGIPGVANSRACAWNRPPIDRMAHLNLEAGDATFDELVGRVENGIYMETNCSWSIDDSRNKFQFGCERARLIKDGRLGPVVKNPNYRGISATFWRNLKGVGNESTVQVMGTPFCGKGEPNQVIRVGHASPVALFADVDVFGGE